jgi:DNA polymerase V
MKAIVDCNSFYCSCERLFRPDLREQPVVVLSNNDGCIISRTDEARRLGVPMGIPYFEARHLIEKHKITVFSSNYHLYGDMSRRVMNTLRSLSPSVEVYSVDEAFLDLEGIAPKDLGAYARHIKDTVEQWTGISVSVGVAATKTLAKMANLAAKKNKKETTCVKIILNPEDQQSILQRTRVSEIWGIGYSYAEKLLNLGISSAWELQNMPESWVHAQLGGVNGLRLRRELKGVASLEMQKQLMQKKMITTTRMFGRPVVELSELREAIATYITRAAEKLRRQQSAAACIDIFVVPGKENYHSGFKRGNSIANQIRLHSPSNITSELIAAALPLLDSLFEKGRTYKKAGVLLSGLVPDDSIQSNIFLPPETNKKKQLMNTLDNVNFGIREDALHFGSTGIKKNWKMRQELRSGRYSSRWEEMMEVK